MILRDIVHTILGNYTLPIFGIHGVSHWARVLLNGLRLAEVIDVNVEVVQLFALFHDSRRINEVVDFMHGQRGAEYALSQRGKLFNLSDEDFELLFTACAYHTDGLTDAHITVQTCWDADRLDLARAGIMPDPAWLCTDAAKEPEIIAWANQRSLERAIPDFVHTKWGVADNLAPSRTSNQ